MGVIPELGVWGRRNFITYMHRMVIGAAGAITSQDPASDSGIVATYNGVTAAGQYILTVTGVGLSKTGFRQYLGSDAMVQIPSGAGAITGGYTMCMRDDNMDAGTRNNTCIVQFLSSAGANADIASGNTVYIQLTVAA
jgi:hypothetical protein